MEILSDICEWIGLTSAMTEKNVKVSVIIPSYNHEKYISYAIDSVLNQSFTDFELLIIDDCSTDESAKVIRSYQDSRIKVFSHDVNVGVVATLNELISKSRGEYIAVLGSDDIWNKEKLEKQIAILDQNKNIGACFSHAEIINGNNKPYSDVQMHHMDVFFENNKNQAEWLRRFYNKGNCLCHSSLLIRKSVHDQLGVYNPVYNQLHDLDMWIRLICRHEIYILEEVLVQYRKVGTKSISSDTIVNNIRTINEVNHLMYNLITTLDDELLINGFEDLFEKKNGDLVAERFFVLSKCTVAGVKNIQPSLAYLFNMNLISILQEQYGMKMNDIYEFTGNEIIYYPQQYIQEMQITQKHYEELIESIKKSYVNSTSWKITKPLRMISKVLKNKLKKAKEYFKE